MAPFRYIPDPGDGTGIEQAFTEAAASGDGAWVHIRRGTYDLDGSSITFPLTILGFKVTGDGDSTVIRMSTTDRRVFLLDNDPAGAAGRAPLLRDVRIDWTTAAQGSSGASVVEAIPSGGPPRTVIDNVQVVKEAGISAINNDEPVTSVFRIAGSGGRLFYCRCINVDGTDAGTVVGFRLASTFIAIGMCAVVGTNVGYRAEGANVSADGSTANGGALFASHNGFEFSSAPVRVTGCGATSAVDGFVAESGAGVSLLGNTLGSASGDGIRIEAGATDCIVLGNRLNGNPFVDAGTGTEAAHNTP